MRSTYLYALIQCPVLSLNPMKYVGVRTQLCRCGTQPNYVGVRAFVSLGTPSNYIALLQWRQKNYASVRRTCLHMVVAVLCLTLQPGQAKRLTKRQRKRVTWFWHVIGQSEASVI